MKYGYRVYSNHGTGGTVDYSSPVATTSELACPVGPLGLATDTTFVVRVYDPGTGLEQAGSEARVRIVIGASGADVSGLPNAPHAVSLSPAAGGGARVCWAYAPAEAWGRPAGFNVFLARGATLDLSSPAATVPYTSGRVGYSCVLQGPLALGSYTAIVRSFNATGAEANTVTVTAILGLPAAFAMEPVLVTSGHPGP